MKDGTGKCALKPRSKSLNTRRLHVALGLSSSVYSQMARAAGALAYIMSVPIWKFLPHAAMRPGLISRFEIQIMGGLPVANPDWLAAVGERMKPRMRSTKEYLQAPRALTFALNAVVHSPHTTQ